METSNKGIELIKHFESLHDGDLQIIGLQPKMCPAGFWTEGYGALVLDNKGNRIKGIANKTLAYKYSKIHNEQEAEKSLRNDLSVREQMINSLGINCLNQNQFDALVSFCYNVGFKALQKSTLLKMIKTNPNDPKIKDEFLRWSYAGSKQLKGLLFRRQAECDLYFNNN